MAVGDLKLALSVGVRSDKDRHLLSISANGLQQRSFIFLTDPQSVIHEGGVRKRWVEFYNRLAIREPLLQGFGRHDLLLQFCDRAAYGAYCTLPNDR